MTKQAKFVRVGDLLAEQEGCYFQASSVSTDGDFITIGLANINGYMVAPRQVTLKKTAFVNIVTE